ncbi:hypothetical protein N0V90_009570 [Kalmusia sp. IMI 367209]|nr:hypothetical protein N0V90_009570 [Kalmusia sp. IMI 367209]
MAGVHFEERSFTYFRINTSAQFAAPFGNEFWSCLVLQIGTREQCVKHAIVALGALHRSFTDEYVSPFPPLSPQQRHEQQSWETSTLAIASYTRALRGLNKHILPTTYEGLHISLLCCVLFISFEWLRGSYKAATTHLQSGLSILRQWSSTATATSSPVAHLIRRQIAPIFVRLAIQARTFSEDIVPMPWLSNGLFTPSDQGSGEEQHLRAARSALDVLCGEVYLRPSDRTLLPADFELSGASSFDFSQRLAKWYAQYHMHILPLPSQTLKRTSEAARPERVSLTLWYTVLCLLQATSQTDDPMAYDVYVPHFEHVVSLARVLGRHKPSPSTTLTQESPLQSEPDPPRFRVDIETVPMLYFVASKCRHPVLRREAIALLRSGASREGLWDGRAAARLSEELVSVEEEGLVDVREAQCVPPSQRVWKMIDETDLRKRTLTVRLQRFGDEDYGPLKILTW